MAQLDLTVLTGYCFSVCIFKNAFVFQKVVLNATSQGSKLTQSYSDANLGAFASFIKEYFHIIAAILLPRLGSCGTTGFSIPPFPGPLPNKSEIPEQDMTELLIH